MWKHQVRDLSSLLQCWLTRWANFADQNTWSSVLKEAREAGDLEIMPYNVDVDYTLWSYRKLKTMDVIDILLPFFRGLERIAKLHLVDVIKSILPQDLHVEIPSGFNTAGHVGERTSLFLYSRLLPKLTMRSPSQPEGPVPALQVHHRSGHLRQEPWYSHRHQQDRRCRDRK